MEKIDKAVAFVNERARLDEEMLEVQSKFEEGNYNFVAPDRVIIKQGILKEVGGSFRPEKVHYFLFNDILIRATAKQKGKLLAVRETIPTEHLIVGVGQKSSFSDNTLIITNSTSGIKHTAFTLTAEERDEWLNAILGTLPKFTAPPTIKPSASTTMASGRRATIASPSGGDILKGAGANFDFGEYQPSVKNVDQLPVQLRPKVVEHKTHQCKTDESVLIKLKAAKRDKKRRVLPEQPTDEETHMNKVLKCAYKKDERFIKLKLSEDFLTVFLSDLERFVEDKFGEKNLVVKYKDDEGDFITIVNKEDLDIAILDFNVDTFHLFDEPDTIISW
eukprot:TRINITY_DN6390_c0_g1_i2.p1 TRINITY_DN6390_c0_g1~~TRINITY_DN6390_c0_g1_i2.p1  ORF type:complete len:333 (+),score=115.23 TRINITY_DN6390_c0_g1_i2:364-1362(+)